LIPGMTVDLPLRRATSADVGAVRDLTRTAYAKWVPIIGRVPKPMTADYAAAVRETIDGGDHLLIENIAVAPACQGRGLGTRLLAHAERLARSRGHAIVRLYTNKLFVENVQLYLRRGYQIDREEAFTGGIVVHMSKQIVEPPSPIAWAKITPAAIKPQITLNQLDAIDVRVGTVLSVEDVPGADKLVALRVSFGDHERTIVGGPKDRACRPARDRREAGALHREPATAENERRSFRGHAFRHRLC
jgi:GNAT superfamily N-acetyltransferase